MSGFASNLVLALVWAMMTGRVSLGQLAIGFVLGFFFLAFSRDLLGAGSYVRRVRSAIALLLIFSWEVVVSSLRVAYDAITPAHHMRPGVLAVPLDARTDLEITLFAGIVSLTPGTLTLDISEDRQTLYVHAMYLADAESVRRHLKSRLERPLLEVLR